MVVLITFVGPSTIRILQTTRFEFRIDSSIFYIFILFFYATFIYLQTNHFYFNHLKPTGYVMHQQSNIQQLYALPTLYLCVLYLSENK